MAYQQLKQDLVGWGGGRLQEVNDSPSQFSLFQEPKSLCLLMYM